MGADAKGSLYFTREHESSIRVGRKTLESAGDSDMFLAKADRAGRVKWVVSMGGPGLESGPEIEVDRAGNSYLAGNFSSTARFGGRTLTSPGTRAALRRK